MASTCKSLCKCKRWQGEILHEISTKVLKVHIPATLVEIHKALPGVKELVKTQESQKGGRQGEHNK